MERNFKLILCYDGTRYRGWQRQGNTSDTIQAKLEALLSRLLGRPVEVHGSGRTDAGVHAAGQAVSFRADTPKSCGELLSEIRQYLPEDIGALSLEEAEPRFHARLSCREKTYVYRIWNSAQPDVFGRRYRTAWPGALDEAAMRRAAALLIGEHDFSAFCTARGKKKSAVRTIKNIELRRDGEELRLVFSGDGFLYNMVRILTGTLLEVGSGRRSAESVGEALVSLNRAQAGFTAPPQGLFLWEVRYDGEN